MISSGAISPRAEKTRGLDALRDAKGVGPAAVAKLRAWCAEPVRALFGLRTGAGTAKDDAGKTDAAETDRVDAWVTAVTRRVD